MPTLLANPRALMIALVAEGSLAAVGALLCWLFGLPLMEQLRPPTSLAHSIALGLLATLPMLAALAVVLRLRWRVLTRLRRQTEQLVQHLLGGAGVWGIVAVSIAAGVGEEVLFRGALQPLLGKWLGPWAGVFAAAVLFGLAHPVSLAYVVLVVLGGVYLGAVTLLTGELLPAIIAHAAYDFVALSCLCRQHLPE